MLKSHEKFRNIASGFQAITIILVALVGAFVAWLQFGSVELSLSVSEFGAVPQGCLIYVSVDVKNTTTRDVNLSLEETPIRVYSLEQIGRNRPSFAPPLEAPLLMSPNLKQQLAKATVPAGQEHGFGGLVAVPGEGVYFFEFSTITDRGKWLTGKPSRLSENCELLDIE